MTKTHDVLWTGGWDSTFRVADLVLVQQHPVQPHYVIYPARPSLKVEIETMDRIRSEVSSPLLLATKFIEQRAIPRDREAPASLGRLREQAPLGGQYQALASYAKSAGLDEMELCIHVDDRAHAFLADHVEVERDGNTRLRGDADPDLVTLFGRFMFPLYGWSKLDMERHASDHGFGELMERTWFCHMPTGRCEPCGLCPPCRFTRNEGLSRRVPSPGLLARIAHHGRRARRWVTTRVR